MVPAETFPPEIWVTILSLLDGIDIRNYQTVCKSFYNWTKTIPALQFLLELDAAGYVKARNHRKGISDEQRLSILREHIRRRRALLPSRVDNLWTVRGGANDPNAMTFLQLLGQVLVFAEGVLIRRMFHQLHVVQLPSPSCGTDMRTWVLEEPAGPKDEFWIQPSFDLLVLLKVDPSAVKIEMTAGGWLKGQYEFHLRTLSGNDKHPDACEPVLCFPNQVLHDLIVKFIGRLMLVQLPVGVITRLVIWDWMTGSILLDKILEHSGFGFTIVSENLIAIPSASLTLEHNGSSIGAIDVFRLDSGSYPELNMSLIGTFELPGITDTLLTHTRTKSVFSAHEVALAFAPELTYSTTADAPVTSPPKLFETSNRERVLQLNVTRYLEETFEDYDPNSGNPELSDANFGRKGPLPICSSLYIPIRSILDKISGAPASMESRPIIPWSEWGSKTRWVHEGTLRGDAIAAGSRCVFPRFNKRGSPGPRCVASILEFHPNLQFNQKYSELREESESESGIKDHSGSVSILGSAPLPLGFDSCFNDASQLAMLPYTMAELDHEAIAGERPVKRRPVIFMSEEHMVIIQVFLYYSPRALIDIRASEHYTDIQKGSLCSPFDSKPVPSRTSDLPYHKAPVCAIASII